VIELPRDEPTLKLLRREFSHETPFGPSSVDAFDIQSVSERAALMAFFDGESKAVKKSRRNISLVFGRRGSGKTNLLKSFVFSAGINIFLSQHVAFERVIDFFDKSFSDETAHTDVFVEQAADVWKLFFRTILIIELVRNARSLRVAESSNLSFLRRYITSLGLDIKESRPFEELFEELPGALDKLFGGEQFKVAAGLAKAINREGLSAKEAWKAFETIAGAYDLSGTIMLDSVEEIPLQFQKSHKCLSGLLKCLSRGKLDQRRAFNIIVALPTEQFYPFYDISSNPNKDFGSNYMLLQWQGAELLHMAVRRYMIYLQLHHSYTAFRGFLGADLSNNKKLNRSFQEIFGSATLNRRGQLERTAAYILRHTQLIPRGFLDILNACARLHDVERQPLVGHEYRGAPVRAGIAEREAPICAEVYHAFRIRFPHIAEVCKAALSELPIFFSPGDFHKVFTRHIKPVLVRKVSVAALADIDQAAALRMLTEIGCVGRVLPNAGFAEEQELLQVAGDKACRYIRAEFEYLSPSALVTNTSSQLCVHPMFAGTQMTTEVRDRADAIVYPLGVILDGD